VAESSNDRLRRLLTLVPWLASHSGISKADAAAHFGMSVAALETDLALVSVTGPGLYGGELVDIYFEDETVTVYDAQGLVQPLRLSYGESTSLLLGLQALQQLPDSDAAAVARLMDKLGLSPDTGLAVQVQPSPFAERIGEAIRSRHDVVFQYSHPVRDELSERVVTPLNIVTADGVDYLVGWCHTAEAARTYRLDRMRSCALGAPSAPHDEVVAELTTPQRRAVIELPVAAEHLLEGVPATVLERAGKVTASIEFGDDAWLVGWLISCGDAVHCISPERIADEVTRRRKSARDAYTLLVEEPPSRR
jgi:proteasome accessory factor C